MKTRLFALLLILSVFAVSVAAAQIDLAPYAMDFSPDDLVAIVRPDLLVTLARNADGFRSMLGLWENGQKVCETELPNAENFNYSLFALSDSFYGAYGIGHTNDSVSLRFYRFTNGEPELFFSLDTSDYYAPFLSPEAFILDKGNGQADVYSWQGERIRTLSLPDAFDLSGIRLQEDGSTLAFGTSADSPYVYRVLRVDAQGRLTLDDYPQAFGPADMQMPYATLSTSGEILVTNRPRGTNSKTVLLTRIDAQGHLLWQKTLAAPDVIVNLSVVELHDDGSTTLYGRSVAHSKQIYTAFHVEIDAQGRIASREFRDCTTPAAYDYHLALSADNRIYLLTDSQISLVVPFEDLPVHDDPGLVLE